MSTKKNLLDRIKAAFAGEPMMPSMPAMPAMPQAPTAPMVMYSFPVDNADPIFVDCSDNGIACIDPNDMVYTDAAMTSPYPDGTYNVTGTQFGFTVANGMVTAITDAAGTGAGNPLEMTAPPQVEPPAPVPPTPVTTEPKMGSYAAQNDLTITNLKLAKHEEAINALFKLCEMLLNQPTTDPKTLPENKKDGFAAKKEASLQAKADALAQLKKASRINY